jgi:hypothetical protein
MTKKDFVTAWLLAARMAGYHTTDYKVTIREAELVWDAIQQQYEGEDE